MRLRATFLTVIFTDVKRSPCEKNWRNFTRTTRKKIADSRTIAVENVS